MKTKLMNFTARIIATFMGIMMLLCVLVACSGEEESSGSNAQSGTITVTFDYNYVGAPDSYTVEVAEGDVVEQPSDPERNNYRFTAWYTAAEDGSKFDFEEALYEDVTVYAHWEQTGATVTFDYNYDDAPDAYTVDVELGEAVSQPTTPTRSDYIFVAWYTEADCENEYDFTNAVTDDFTLYAGWEEDSGDTVTITYYWNYDDAPNDGVVDQVTLTNGRKTSSYAATRTGYYLGGWYTDSECTEKFDFSNRIYSDMELYAKWLYIYTFEAEYVDFTGMVGYGYSGNVSGVGCIVKQKADSQNASNGYYVGWMYCYGNTLSFNIESDKEVDDAVIVLRLSAEFYDMTFTDETYLVQVNGENLSYSDISITDVPEQGTNEWKAFANYTISTSVSLQEGSNVINLVVNNSNRLGESGTMYATAPLTDCLYVYSDAELTWDPLTDNLDGNIS